MNRDADTVGDVVNIKCDCCGKTIPSAPYQRSFVNKVFRFCNPHCHRLFVEYKRNLVQTESLLSPEIIPAGAHGIITKVIFTYRGSDIFEKIKGLDGVRTIGAMAPRRFSVILHTMNLSEEETLIDEIGRRLGSTEITRQTTQYFSGI